MKNLLIVAILLFTAINITAQDQRLAKVKKLKGIELYILSEPLRTYEVVADKHQRKGIYQKDANGKMPISSKVEMFVKKTLKDAKKNKYDFDAILYTNGKRAFAIRFTDQPTKETKGIGKVRLMNGMPVFIMAEPITDYSIITEKRQRGNFAAHMSMGIHKRPIEKDVDRFTDRLKSKLKDGEVDALYYSYGKVSNGIKFE